MESLDDDAIVAAAYPTQWSVAQVLSHLGSAAEIMRRRFEDALAGRSHPSARRPRPAPAGAPVEADRDLTLTADALIRLVYGRLDPDHTPAELSDDRTIDRLRQTFGGP